MAKVSVEIDVGEMEERIAAAVFARVQANFGALMADALRGGLPTAPAAPTPQAPAAPATWAPPLTRVVTVGTRERMTAPQRDVHERADRVYEAIKAHPWCNIHDIAAATGIAEGSLLLPLALLRGKDSRGKATGDPARIQSAGSRRWLRYAVVGLKQPTDLR